MPYSLEFDPTFDMRSNLERVIEITPILRTRFNHDIAIDDVKLNIEADDIDVMAPFDLQNGPLCRFSVKDNILTGCIHHSIFDGKSTGLFL